MSQPFPKIMILMMLLSTILLLGNSHGHQRGLPGVAPFPTVSGLRTNQKKYERKAGQIIDPHLLRRGHSHNDYHQQSPLDSALKHGLRSIEVDVFPVHGELLVAHTRFELLDAKNIDELYIQPILQLLKKNEIRTKNKGIHARKSARKLPLRQDIRLTDLHSDSIIDPRDESLILLVDFKADPNLSARLLQEALQPLKRYLTKVKKNGKYRKGHVTVIVSGNQPKDHSLLSDAIGDNRNNDCGGDNDNSFWRNTSRTNIGTNKNGGIHRRRPRMTFVQAFRPKQKSKSLPASTLTLPSTPVIGYVRKSRQKEERYLFLDGRIKDLYRSRSSSLVPLISVDWKMVQIRQLFGKGETFLQDMSDLAHEQGKRLRIWGAPNREDVWRSMIRNNVDWLSVDNHPQWTNFVSGMCTR